MNSKDKDLSPTHLSEVPRSLLCWRAIALPSPRVNSYSSRQDDEDIKEVV
ncbi:MAG TPA: hypothetical protein V6C85_26380 [Allocoleopsis sp.]